MPDAGGGDCRRSGILNEEEIEMTDLDKLIEAVEAAPSFT
jgi:hypothetical protein